MQTGERSGEYPEHFESETELDEWLTRPRAPLIEFIRTLPSPLVILGAGGKMGPTLAVLAQRAASAVGHPLRVIAVSRFSDPATRLWLEQRGVATHRADLLDPEAVRRLPDAANVVYLVGLKFGTAKAPATTWAINTLVPTLIAERYARTRMVALSTGNVYPLTEVQRGGSSERDPLHPLGEYANAAVARERLFEFGAARNGLPLALLRLYYAVELRYGVIVDLARMVQAGAPIPLANGWFNCIWQGDANELILRALALASSPPSAWNLCRPERFSVREIARKLGERLGREPSFTGTEAATALLGNPTPLCRALGTPSTPIDPILTWVAHWVKHNGRDLGKPTHFEVRDGNY